MPPRATGLSSIIRRYPAPRGPVKALSPAELIVVDRDADAVKLALSIGADHGVVADGDHVEEVLGLTGGNRAEVVIDYP
ncbi:MAG TPA: hypothetical protein VIT65_26815 [Microlunatus sp.]